MKQELNLFNNIEIKLLKAFNHRYNAHTPAVVFHKNKKCNSNEILFHRFKVKNDKSILDFFSKRLPQTRIIVNELYAQSFVLKEIILPDTSIILYYPLNNSDELFQLKIAIKTEHIICDSESNVFQNDDFVLSNKSIYLVSRDKSNSGCNNPATLFEKTWLNELAIHPLNQISSSDINFLKDLDDAWYRLRNIFREDEIIPEIDDTQILLILEIFLHLGRLQQTEKIIQKFRTPSLYNFLIQRLKSVVTENALDIDVKELSEFAQDYYLSEHNSKKVEKFWHKIHFPAAQYFVKKAVQENKQQFVFFTLLAQKMNFSWKNMASQLVANHLDELTRNLFSLLLQLKNHTPLYFDQEYITFRNNSLKLQAEMELKENPLNCASKHFNNQFITNYSLADKVIISVSEKAAININKKTNSIKIIPVHTYPSFNDDSFNFATINYDNWIMKVALAWQQFTIKLNNLRISFLRKKGRFQLSIKNLNKKPLIINGQSIDNREDGYSKIQIDVSKKPSALFVDFLNQMGGLPIHNKYSSVNGFVLDRFGILHDNFRIKNEQNRSYLQNKNCIKFNKNSNYIVSCRYAEPALIKPKALNGFIASFLYTDLISLNHRIVIVCNQQSDEISSVFYKYFGILPTVVNDIPFDFPKETFIFVINEFFREIKVNLDNKLKILKLTESGQKAILIHPEYLDEVISEHFFVLNKFDFI